MLYRRSFQNSRFPSRNSLRGRMSEYNAQRMYTIVNKLWLSCEAAMKNTTISTTCGGSSACECVRGCDETIACNSKHKTQQYFDGQRAHDVDDDIPAGLKLQEHAQVVWGHRRPVMRAGLCIHSSTQTTQQQ